MISFKSYGRQSRSQRQTYIHVYNWKKPDYLKSINTRHERTCKLYTEMGIQTSNHGNRHRPSSCRAVLPLSSVGGTVEGADQFGHFWHKLKKKNFNLSKAALLVKKWVPHFEYHMQLKSILVCRYCFCCRRWAKFICLEALHFSLQEPSNGWWRSWRLGIPRVYSGPFGYTRFNVGHVGILA